MFGPFPTPGRCRCPGEDVLGAAVIQVIMDPLGGMRRVQAMSIGFCQVKKKPDQWRIRFDILQWLQSRWCKPKDVGANPKMSFYMGVNHQTWGLYGVVPSSLKPL